MQKVFWTQGAKNLLHRCKIGLHRCKTGFGRCKRPLGNLCSLGPKHLLHPLVTTFGMFQFSTPSPRRLGLQSEANPNSELRKRKRKQILEELSSLSIGYDVKPHVLEAIGHNDPRVSTNPKSIIWISVKKRKYRAELKVTHLRWQSPICENLRFPAKICGFLRFSCALQMLEFPGEGVTLRKSAVFCENLRFGRSLSP